MMSFNYLIISKQNSIHFSPFLSQMTGTLSFLSLRFSDSGLYFTLIFLMLHTSWPEPAFAPSFFNTVQICFFTLILLLNFLLGPPCLCPNFCDFVHVFSFCSFANQMLSPLKQNEVSEFLLVCLHFHIPSYFIFFSRPLASNLSCSQSFIWALSKCGEQSSNRLWGGGKCQWNQMKYQCYTDFLWESFGF